jgi:DNA-binding beta-propeller fold protein YncE
MQSGTVSVLDTREPGRGEEIRVGRTTVQVAVSPDGRFVYVSLNEDDAVAKLDLRSGKVVVRARTCRGPVQIYLTPGGETLLAACQGTPTAPSDELDFVDTTTMRVTGTLATGAGAHGVVVEPSGRHAFVTHVWDGTVAVVDLASRTVVDHVVGASQPPPCQPHARGAANMRSPREVVVPLGGRTDGSTGGGHSH